VAATQGLPLPLAEKVESLSGYRPLYPPLDAKGKQNPVVHSHLRITVGGKTYSVLSRITSAGLDYSQRANKFAHHVILEAGELPAAGPAWLQSQPGFMESQWDGEVRVIPSGRLPPDGDAAPSVCRSWREVTGDAGWGGVLADWFERDPNRQVYLLFEPGLDLLPLIAETVALLPVERRWQVSFSTYFTGLPQGIPCLWRCVVKDSPEARNASRLPGQQVLNLCELSGQAPAGEFVNLARTGDRVSSSLRLGKTEGKSTDWLKQSEFLPEQGELLMAKSGGGVPLGWIEHRGLDAPTSHKGSSPKLIDLSLQGANSGTSPPPLRERKRVSRSWLWAGIIGFVFGTGLGAIVVYNHLAAGDDEAARIESLAKSEEDSRAELSKGKEEITKLSKEIKDLQIKEKNQTQDLATARAESKKKDEAFLQIKRQRDEDNSQSKAKISKLEGKLREAKDKDSPKKPKRIVDRGFSLPKWVISKLDDKKTNAEIGLSFKAGKDYNLRLLGLDDNLLKQSFNKEGVLHISVKRGAEEVGELATFRIEERKLLFKWDPHDGELHKQAQARLRNCVLEIVGSQKSAHVALREPITIREDQLRFGSPLRLTRVESLKDDDQGWPPSEDLYFGSIEMRLNDDIFWPNVVSAKSRPELTILPRAIYMKVEDLYVVVATIENGKE
jgi:hypothetical protein